MGWETPATPHRRAREGEPPGATRETSPLLDELQQLRVRSADDGPLPEDPDGPLDEAAALDAALRAAMDGDWEGRAGSSQLAAAALPALAADAASRPPTSMGYMELDGSVAAALMPGGADPGGPVDPSAGAGDARYILPRLDDEPFMLPALSDAQQREQMEEIQRTLAAARSASDPAEL